MNDFEEPILEPTFEFRFWVPFYLVMVPRNHPAKLKIYMRKIAPTILDIYKTQHLWYTSATKTPEDQSTPC